MKTPVDTDRHFGIHYIVNLKQLTDTTVIRQLHRRYMSGELMPDLSQEFGVCQKTLRNRFREHDLAYRFRRNPNCDYVSYDVQKLHQRYIRGESVQQLAREAGIRAGSLLDIFKQRHLQRFPPIRRAVFVSQAAAKFSSIQDEQSAYWLGFMLADGSMSTHRRQNRVVYNPRLTLTRIDRYHLLGLKKWLACGQVYTYAKTCVYSGPTSPSWTTLLQYGFGEAKAGRLRWPKIETRLYRHFIRGFFDGDGSFWYRDSNASWSLYSISKSFLMSCALWLTQHSVKNQLYQQRQKAGGRLPNGHTRKSSVIWKVMVFRRADLVALYQLLYGSQRICLRRKYAKFLAWYNTVLKRRVKAVAQCNA